MALKLYNTLGRQLQEFVPINPGKVLFYGCGLTVYNYAHIGNLRAYLTHDILTRTLKRFGYDVNHVMNITDVGHLSGDNDEGDDKMVRSAEERGKTVLEIADFYTQAFFSDMGKLSIGMPNVVCKATEHIEEIIALIKRIEEAGFSYQAGGNLYFDISKFPTYSEFAMLRLDDQKAGARTAQDENKRNAQDFVLWFTKSKFENQALVWDSPWGKGYPGWHIECSAMSIKYLGEQFDIHAGGVDHIPIHHTNEIAQSEAATGKRPWVRYWLHNEFLVIAKDKSLNSDEGKMSKSEGNFITLQTLIDKGYDPLDYRYFLLGAHYRSQLQFSYEALDGAQNARKSLMDKIRLLTEKFSDEEFSQRRKETEDTEFNAKYMAAFDNALEDDLNTPRALAELWGLLKDNSLNPKEILGTVLEMDKVLGLSLDKALQKDETTDDPAFTAAVETLINERSEAKKAKNFTLADEIRTKITKMGITLTDTPAGTTWKKR